MLYQNGPSLFDRLSETSRVDLQTGAIAPIEREERVETTMKIKMIKNAPGSIDGINAVDYQEGQIYDVPLFIANSFEAKGYAVKVDGAPAERKVIIANEFKAEDLAVRTVDELREIAKSSRIAGYSKLNKEDLIQAILVMNETHTLVE